MNKLGNKKLNELDVYKDKKCIHCGRKYPQTILNIEGVIHHKEDYRCLDTKSCMRYKKHRKGK